jgi:Ca2+-binding RTX toxin-like protein
MGDYAIDILDRLNPEEMGDPSEGPTGLGTEAAETLTGDAGDDILDARAGDDRVEGGAGNDIFIASEGDDTVAGGAGADSIVAGAGDDLIDPGAGDDVLAFRPGDGHDTVTGFELGGGADFGDRLDLSAHGLTFAELALTETAEGLNVQAGADSILLAGLTAADLEERHVVTTAGAPAPTAVLETGTTTLTHEAQTVALSRDYVNPVALAWVATENGADPVTVRLSQVSGDALTMHLQEPNHLDGTHFPETVNWMVVEAGTWRLGDGTLIEAGTLATDKLSPQGFEQVTFEGAFDARPVVLSQVQTANGGDFVVTRQTGADADGFRVTMQEEEALNGGRHRVETLGWVAVEAGAGSADGFDWVAGRAGGVDDGRSVLDLSAELPGGAHAIAALSSFAGSDTAWARGDGGTGGRINLSVEEERSLDAETGHVDETVDYFAFGGAGTVWGYDDGLFA